MNRNNALKKYKISFCTTCMDRIHHLNETLLSNLNDNKDYENLEFVVLNYNSKDSLDEWIEDNMIQHIKSGRLVYIKTLEPEHFKMAHAKNMVTKFAKGDIVCNIDADNFTGTGFASEVNKEFNKNQNVFLTGGQIGNFDLMGRVCLWKSDFLKLRGYDERIQDFGYEDTDFYSRLRSIGRKEVKISNSSFLNSIKHDDYERMKNGKYFKEIEQALVLEEDGIIKSCILKIDHEFEFNTIIQGASSVSYEGAVFDKTAQRSGKWFKNRDELKLEFSGSKDLVVLKTSDGGETYSNFEGTFKTTHRTNACLFFSLLKGQMIFQENMESLAHINSAGFGEGTLMEPFI